jgi:Mg-chelatase subunit ChlD
MHSRHYKLPIFWTLLVWIIFHATCMAQVSIAPSRLDFGITSPQTIWVRDLIVTNEGQKSDFLLRHTFSHEYSILLSAKTMAPDSSIVIRVQFKPREKTVYNEKIELYFASMDKPIVIPMYADVRYLNPDDHLACPDFTKQAKDCCPQFMFVAEVTDAASGAPIPKATLSFEPMAGQALRMQTSANGKVSRDMPIDYYYIKVAAEGYKSSISETYINHRKNYLNFELEPLRVASIPKDTLAKMSKDTLVTAVDLRIAQSVPIEDTLLLSKAFAPNNVLFLMDVSASMAREEKLQLMQASIRELSRVLRPEDQITLMVYSDEARLLLATCTGDHKDEVMLSVSTLKASGNTNGAAGFKEAYKILQKHKIKDGNNQLFVITDGAFATTDQALIMKSVKRNKRKGMSTSIIAIQANIFAQKNLESVALLGHGQLIAIDTLSDTRLIIEDLKAHSISK